MVVIRGGGNGDGMVHWAIPKPIVRHLGRDRDNSPHYWSSSLDRGRDGTTGEVGTHRYRVCHS